MRKPRQAGMAFIMVTLFLDVLGIGIIVPVLPHLVTEMLGGDTSLAASYYGLLAGAYALMQFLFAPIWGRISDRVGRRPILLICLLGTALSFVVFGLADSLALLFIGRILAGFFGAVISTVHAFIADVTAPEDRAHGMGLVGAAFGLGFIFGPALGGVSHLGFATVFEAADVSYLLTFSSLAALPAARPDLSIRGNQLRGERLSERLSECATVDHLLFAENACEMNGGGKEPLIGQFSARTLTASNNRLIATGDADTLHLHPAGKQAIVMGNTSTGNIRVPSGSPVPNDPLLTNIIGI